MNPKEIAERIVSNFCLQFFKARTPTEVTSTYNDLRLDIASALERAMWLPKLEAGEPRSAYEEGHKDGFNACRNAIKQHHNGNLPC